MEAARRQRRPDDSIDVARQFSPELCAELVAQRPRGFPAIDCATATPERTINAFIDYYERALLGFTGLDGASDKLRGLQEQAADLAANAFVFDRSFRLFSLDKNDEIIVAQIQFFIGPIPVNLEIMTTVRYGADITASALFKPGEVIAEMIRLNGSDAARPIAFIKAEGRPRAGVGLAAFAGVGFSVPGFTAKLGIESRLNLGTVYVPVHAGAGIGIGSEVDTRPPPADFEQLVSGTNLIQPKRIIADFQYSAGLGVKVRDLLSGDVAGKLKIKVLFFSKTWRKTLLGQVPASRELSERVVALLRAAKSEREKVRALRGVANSAYDGAIDAVAPLLDAPEFAVRAAATEALRLMTDPRVDALIGNRARTDADARVRLSAVRACSRRAASPALRQSLSEVASKDSNDAVRQEATRLVGSWLKEHADLRLTLQTIAQHDTNQRIREVAVAALASG